MIYSGLDTQGFYSWLAQGTMEIDLDTMMDEPDICFDKQPFCFSTQMELHALKKIILGSLSTLLLTISGAVVNLNLYCPSNT